MGLWSPVTRQNVALGISIKIGSAHTPYSIYLRGAIEFLGLEF